MISLIKTDLTEELAKHVSIGIRIKILDLPFVEIHFYKYSKWIRAWKTFVAIPYIFNGVLDLVIIVYGDYIMIMEDNEQLHKKKI